MENEYKKKETQRYDKEQYDILIRCSNAKNISEWNEWRDDNKCVEINLEQVNLIGTNLEGANLESANLNGAHLFGSSLKNVNLSSAELEGANLESANLEGANLENARMREIYTVGINLRGANLRYADMEKANMEASQLEGANLEKVYLWKSNLEGSKLNGVNLRGAYLEGVNFESANIEGSDLREIFIGEFNDEFTNFSNALFGDAKFSLNKECKTNPTEIIEALSKAEVNNMRFIDPIFGRKVRDEAWLYHLKENCKKKRFKKIGLYLWKWTCDYGRSFLRWALVSLGIAIIFAFIFWPCPDFLPDWWIILSNKIGPELEQTSEAFKGQSPGFLSLLYFSIVTFTTLGFGDIVAANTTARFLVTIEVIIGYVMLGSLISILANKLARRND